mgnify:CR=1 FL=1
MIENIALVLKRGEKMDIMVDRVRRQATLVKNHWSAISLFFSFGGMQASVLKDTTQDFDKIFTQDARRGLPDRRKLRSRSLFGDDLGYTFLTDFRAAAQRFGHDAKFACPPLTPSDTKLVQVGEAPMWCTYMSADKKDLIVISMVTEGGEAKIDYVGFLEEAPDGPLRADGEPPPPPVRVSDAERANKRVETMKAQGDQPGATPGASPARPAPTRPQPATKPAG